MTSPVWQHSKTLIHNLYSAHTINSTSPMDMWLCHLQRTHTFRPHRPSSQSSFRILQSITAPLRLVPTRQRKASLGTLETAIMIIQAVFASTSMVVQLAAIPKVHRAFSHSPVFVMTPLQEKSLPSHLNLWLSMPAPNLSTALLHQSPLIRPLVILQSFVCSLPSGVSLKSGGWTIFAWDGMTTPVRWVCAVQPLISTGVRVRSRYQNYIARAFDQILYWIILMNGYRFSSKGISSD
jgi:hypothetical protein